MHHALSFIALRAQASTPRILLPHHANLLGIQRPGTRSINLLSRAPYAILFASHAWIFLLSVPTPPGFLEPISSVLCSLPFLFFSNLA
jgi:hypothetical protein